jgi:Domain of unknown function (DUF4189)
MHKGEAGVLATAVLAAALLAGAGGSARADGALAVGSTGDVVKYGIAFGMVVDEPKGKAAEMALQRCQTFKAREAADRCRVVATFSTGECYAVAYDPKSGTPGAGWAVGPDQATANKKALAMCEETAGPERKGFCRVESADCDTAGPAGAKSGTWPTESSDLPERYGIPEPGGGGWDIPLPVLLLLGVAAAGVAYILNRVSKGKAASATSTPAKGKSLPAKPAKGKTKRVSR